MASLRLFRGTTAQNNARTLPSGQITADTTKNVVVLHDGSTAGGHPMAREDFVGITDFNFSGSNASVRLPTGTTQQRPSVTSPGMIRQNSTTGRVEVATDTSGTWVNLVREGDSVGGGTAGFSIPVGTSLQRPTSPTQGMLRYNRTTSRLETWNGAAWANILRDGDTFKAPTAGHADTAGRATTAGTADNATNAGRATSAGTADNAARADTANATLVHTFPTGQGAAGDLLVVNPARNGFNFATPTQIAALQGNQGNQGTPGQQGESGEDDGFSYNFSSSVSGAEPTSGTFKFNSANIRLGNLSIAIADNDAETSPQNLQGIWRAIGQINSAGGNKATLHLRSETGTAWAFIVLTAAVQGTSSVRYSFRVLGSSASSPFSNGEAVRISLAMAGERGATGPAGRDGAAGAQGAQGLRGNQGIQGPAGAAGQAGATGRAGNDGAQGIPGPAGAAGAAGARGANGTTSDIPYNWNGTGPAVNPGDITVNNADMNNVTQLTIHHNDRLGSTRTSTIDRWDDSTSTDKGVLHLYAENISSSGNAGRHVDFVITAIRRGTGRTIIDVDRTKTNPGQANPFSLRQAIRVDFSPTGDRGQAGRDGTAADNTTAVENAHQDRTFSNNVAQTGTAGATLSHIVSGDLGGTRNFVIRASAVSNGRNTIEIQTSDNNASWTTKTINDTLTARYVRIIVRVAPTGNAVPTLTSSEFTVVQKTNRETFLDFESATLTGTSAASRVVPTSLNYNRFTFIYGDAANPIFRVSRAAATNPPTPAVARITTIDPRTFGNVPVDVRIASLIVEGLPAMRTATNGNILTA